MAQVGDADQLNCSICLDFLNDPVTTPCGHSYCKVCIKGYWEQKDKQVAYSCLQCRRTFIGIPVLKRNIKLAEAIAKLVKTGTQTQYNAQDHTRPATTKSDAHSQYDSSEIRRLVKTPTQNTYPVDDKLLTVAADQHEGTVLAAALTTTDQQTIIVKAYQLRIQEREENFDPETVKTQEMLAQMNDIVDGLGPENFQEKMKEVFSFTIKTEERLAGIVELIYKRAISNPDSSAYAHMCHCLMGLKVPTSANRGITVNFRKLLLNRCQTDFQRNNSELLEKMEKKLETITKEEDRPRLKEELNEAKEEVLGNSRFICELFKLKIMTECLMHDCIGKLLKKGDGISLECLCIMLTTINKDLDHEKAKPRMDQYYKQIEKIVKNRTTCSRIRSKLQEVLDLRQVPGDVEGSIHSHRDWSDMEKDTSSPQNICLHLDDKQHGVSSECVADLHEEQDTVSVAGEMTTKQTDPNVRTYQQRIQENEEEIQRLRQKIESVKCLAQATVEESERFYTKMIEKRSSEVRELIRTKEKEVLKEVEGFLQTLEQEIVEMRRAEAEHKQLSPTYDLPHFFQKLPPINLVFKNVQRCVSGLHNRFEDISESDFKKMSSSVEENLGPYTLSSLCSKAVEEQDLEGYLDLETVKTQEMLAQMDYLLHGLLDPENFQEMMKVVSSLNINTEERLESIIDLIYEWAVSNMDSSEVYANMCRSLMGVLNKDKLKDRTDISWRLRVPTSDNPGQAGHFRQLLLNRCQKDFERDNNELLKEKVKELETTTKDEERRRLRGELKEAKKEVLGNSRFMCELFKVKILTEDLMHDCIGKLLKNGDEISLECLCIMLTTINKDLDHEKAKPRMDHYYREIELIVKQRKSSPRICDKLHEVLDIRNE